jgi:hypothetical protein
VIKKNNLGIKDYVSLKKIHIQYIASLIVPDLCTVARWFHQGPNPFINSQDWLFSGGYWDRNYTQLQLADIY